MGAPFIIHSSCGHSNMRDRGVFPFSNARFFLCLDSLGFITAFCFGLDFFGRALISSSSRGSVIRLSLSVASSMMAVSPMAVVSGSTFVSEEEAGTSFSPSVSRKSTPITPPNITTNIIINLIIFISFVLLIDMTIQQTCLYIHNVVILFSPNIMVLCIVIFKFLFRFKTNIIIAYFTAILR